MLSRVPQLFLILSAIYLTIGLLGVCLLFEYKPISVNETSIQSTDSSANSYSFSEDSEVLVRSCSPVVPSYSVRRAVFTRFFPLLWLTFAFSTQTVYFVNSMIKAFGSSYISDDHYLAVVLSLSYIVNCIGSVFWGNVLDRFKFRVSTTTVLLLITNGTLVDRKRFY